MATTMDNGERRLRCRFGACHCLPVGGSTTVAGAGSTVAISGDGGIDIDVAVVQVVVGDAIVEMDDEKVDTGELGRPCSRLLTLGRLSKHLCFDPAPPRY